MATKVKLIDNTISPTLAGGTFTSHVHLGDSDQIRWGDSNDGTIHHDGSHFRLRAGTGNFNVQANDFHITDASNSSVRFSVDHDGATRLYHNATQKLETSSAGATVSGTLTVTGDLDITGNVNSASVTDLDVTDKTITLGVGQTEAQSGSSGIIIDGSNASILWDETTDVFDFNKGISTTGSVGIGIANPTTALEVIGDIKIKQGSGYSNYALIDATEAILTLETYSVNTSSYAADILFKPAETERMRITDDGKVGIGTNNPGQKLDVAGIIRSNSTNPQVRIHTSSGTGTGYLVYGDSADDDVGQIFYNHSNNKMGFVVGGGSADVTINSSGNVGIGTDSPNVKLDVRGEIAVAYDATYGLRFYNQGRSNWSSIGNFATDTTADLNFKTGGGLTMTMTHAKKVGIGTNQPGEALEVDGIIEINRTGDHPALRFAEGGTTRAYFGSGDWAINGGADDDFGISSSGTGDLLLGTTAGVERMRIDSAGTIFQGTTSPTLHSAVRGIVFENGSIINDVTRGAGKSITLAQNAAVDSGNTWAYLATDEASYYQQFNGNHYFGTAPSGSAGADITFSNRMFISNDGDVGVGTSTPFGQTSNRTCFSVNGTSSVSLNIGVGDAQKGYMYTDGNMTQFGSVGAIPLKFAPNDTARMTIDSNGNTTNPSQPSFMCYPTSHLTQLSGARQTTFGSESFDRGGNYNTSNGRFTAPVAGRYLFVLQLALQVSSTTQMYHGIGVRVNGAGNVYFGGWASKASGSVYDQQSSTIILELAANDYVESYIELHNGTTVLGGSGGSHSRWSGQLLS